MALWVFVFLLKDHIKQNYLSSKLCVHGTQVPSEARGIGSPGAGGTGFVTCQDTELSSGKAKQLSASEPPFSPILGLRLIPRVTPHVHPYYSKWLTIIPLCLWPWISMCFIRTSPGGVACHGCVSHLDCKQEWRDLL